MGSLNDHINFKSLELETLSTSTIDYLYPGLERFFLGLCQAIAKDFFQSSLKLQNTCQHKLDDLLRQLQVVSPYEKMIDFLLSLLSDGGYVSIQGDDIIWQSAFFLLPSKREYMSTFGSAFPKFLSYANLLCECSESYMDIFSGNKSYQSVLYEGGNAERLEYIYKNTPKLGYEGGILQFARDIILDYSDLLKEKPSIMEFGGGQGVFTRLLLPFIDSEFKQYTFTDVSSPLVLQSKQAFGAEKMTFEVLDIERLEHSITAYNILVGFNIIHAVKNIKEVMLSLYEKKLKRGGLLIFIENVIQQPWIDCLYGITKEWWHFNDGIRTSSPLLTLRQWEPLLAECFETERYAVLPKEKPHVDNSETGLIVIQKG